MAGGLHGDMSYLFPAASLCGKAPDQLAERASGFGRQERTRKCPQLGLRLLLSSGRATQAAR